MNLGINIEEFNDDQSSESDSNDIDKRVVEEDNSSEHDGTPLENRLKGPNKESLAIQASAFLQSLVKWRELHDRVSIDVFIEDEGEDGERGVDGGVAQHEEAVVDGDGHEEEDHREQGLDHCYDQASVDYELAED